MKPLTYFLEKAPYWKVYLIWVVVIFLMFFGMFKVFATADPKLTQEVVLKLSVSISLFLGIPFTLLISLQRSSTKFYKQCDELEEKVKKAETKWELEKIWAEDFKSIASKTVHHSMVSRLKEIKAMMTTKFEMFSKEQFSSELTEKLLAKCLDSYVREKHTQEECIGFIDGFKEAFNQINNNA